MAKRSDSTPYHHGQQILDHFCAEIYHGRLQPGEQLPPRTDLAEQHETTGLTIQRAFNRLIEDGLLETLPRQGTFVAENPPNLRRIGVVYHALKDQPGWRGLDATLDALVQEADLESSYELVSYYGVEPHIANGMRNQLIEDLSAHRLMGLIFAVAPAGLDLGPFLERDDLGKVAIQEPSRNRLVPAISFQATHLLPSMIDHLVDTGCQRLALICHTMTPETKVDAFLEGLNKRGLRADPTWVQASSLMEPRWAANITRLLLRGSNEDRPDGLIITDDTLVEPVLAGIQQSECRVPEDLRVVAYCNFPLLQPDALPIKRMGFDMGTVLSKGIQALEEQRLGTFDGNPIEIPCIFQDDRPVAPTAVTMETLEPLAPL